MLVRDDFRTSSLSVWHGLQRTATTDPRPRGKDVAGKYRGGAQIHNPPHTGAEGLYNHWSDGRQGHYHWHVEKIADSDKLKNLLQPY